MQNEIIKFREQIDKIDKKIFSLLEERFEIVRQVGKYKEENSIQIKDNNREEEMVNFMKNNTGLDDNFIEEFYDFIFKKSREMQK